MSVLQDFVAEYNIYFLAGLLALVLISLAYSVVVSRRLARLYRRFNNKLADGSVGEIIECLNGQIDSLARVESRLDQISAEQARQGSELAGCVQSVGMVRFDAYDDVGGEQSFAIVLLDGNRSGVAISCLYGRQDSRFYAKAITNGVSERALSDEEQVAMAKALAKCEQTAGVRA